MLVNVYHFLLAFHLPIHSSHARSTFVKLKLSPESSPVKQKLKAIAAVLVVVTADIDKFCLKFYQRQKHIIILSMSLRFSGHFSRWTWVSQYQNVCILDFIGAKDDGAGGDNWS